MNVLNKKKKRKGIHCKKLLKKAKIDIGEIAINSIPDVPIWDSEPVTVDFT